MYILVALGLLSFSLCLVMTPLCRDMALRYDLVDHPDQERKLHGRPIPRIGGVPIALAYVVALLIVFAFAPVEEKLYIQHKALLWALLPSGAIVFFTGLLDDLIGLKPWQKLAGQAAAASLAVGLGTHFTTTNSHFFAHHPALAAPWLIYPISGVWLIGCTNAVNLIDGLDGLACGVGLFATVTTLLVGIFTRDTGMMLATLPLAGSLLAFLCFNFSPASVFLGDCGSLTIGFALGCFTLIWSQRSGTIMGLAAPLMALALPLLDVGLAICRRYLRHVPIFKGDRGHIHHMVLARGYQPRTATLILYGVCAVAAGLALVQNFSPSYIHVMVIGVFILLAWSGINYLDYIEIGAAWRAVSSKRVLREVRDEIYLCDLKQSMLSAESEEGCWAIVRKVCAEMEFDGVEMMMHEVRFEHGSTDAESTSWLITLPLGDRGYLKLCRCGHDMPAKLMMSAVERLQEDLTEKAVTLANEPYIINRPVRSAVIGQQDRFGGCVNWNLLQISDVLDIEFGSALAERVPVLAWEPQREIFPRLRIGASSSYEVADPPLTVHRFPLLRGYARKPWSALARIGSNVTDHLLRHTSDPEDSPLICTIPYFAPVAEQWPGPVIYWLTDLMEQYTGANSEVVHNLDRRMCRIATLVCPNSQRLADYLVRHGKCAPGKIRIVPNATRQCNLLPQPLGEPGQLPLDIAGVKRPIAGVIGNLAGNMDWFFLEELIRATQRFTWVLVGPVTMHIEERGLRAARKRVLRLPNVRVVGPKPYGDLAAYARCFDVAVLPYRRCEPTYSGSSTRFYEHLAACRPMIATRGFEELLHKEPLLRLVDHPEQARTALLDLQYKGFDDGLSALRWEASHRGTWQVRAEFVEQELERVRKPAMQKAS